MLNATAAAVIPKRARWLTFPGLARTIQQVSPISIIETPMVLRISTRSKSVHGAQPQAIKYSCSRKSNPRAKISAPRRIVLRAIGPGATPLRISLSVTSANEIPARKRNKGAGSVPPSCEYIKKVDLRASGESQAS